MVTGAAGFIGSRICELLAGTDTAVVAIDNFDPYYDVSLKRYRWDKLQPLDHVHCQELDITDVPALEALFEAHSFDAVVNMAAMAGVRFSIENPAKYFRVNTQGFVGLLETMKKYGVTQVVQEHLLFVRRASYAFPRNPGCTDPHLTLRRFQARRGGFRLHL